MSSWHSIGPVASAGTSAANRGFISSCTASPAWASAMRGSGGSTVDGGGQGWFDSHSRSERAAGSSASRKDNAVEPVRGRPSPISGASIDSSSISGWRRYQSSTCKRVVRSRVNRNGSATWPSSLRLASVSIEWTRRSSPSRNESSPKSLRPVCSLAAASNPSASIDPPVVDTGDCHARGIGGHESSRGRCSKVRSRSAMVLAPRRLNVRTRSAPNHSRTRSTPRSPAAPSP